MAAEVFTAITTKELGVSKNPVGQQATITDPGIASQANLAGADTVSISELHANLTSLKTAIDTIIDRLQAFGLIE